MGGGWDSPPCQVQEEEELERPPEVRASMYGHDGGSGGTGQGRKAKGWGQEQPLQGGRRGGPFSGRSLLRRRVGDRRGMPYRLSGMQPHRDCQEFTLP